MSKVDTTLSLRRCRELLASGKASEAVADLRELVRSGEQSARVELARALLQAPTAETDAEEAARLLQDGDAGVDPAAAYQLALIALGGQLLERDPIRIAGQILLAGKTGTIGAVRSLALALARHTRPDVHLEARRLWAAAARAGDPVAALLLAAHLGDAVAAGGDRHALDELEADLARRGLSPLPALPATAAAPDSGPPGYSVQQLMRSPPARQVHASPRIRLISGLLSRDECRFLIALARPHLKRAQVFDRAEGAATESSQRSSANLTLPLVLEDFHARLLQLRMALAAGAELVQAEPLEIMRYGPGEQYRPHRDYLPQSALDADRPAAGQRRTTICVYLSTPDAGGETDFPRVGVRVPARAGDALVFDNLYPDGRPDPDSLHAGLPVQQGEKWLATLWIRQRRYRDY